MADAKDPPPPRSQQRPLTPGASSSRPASPRNFADDDGDLIDIPNSSTNQYSRKKSSPTHAPIYRSLGVRRTLVPILLTCGVGLPALGVMWFFTQPDSPFREIGIGIPITLIVLGAILLAVAILNMLQLKRELKTRRVQ